MPFSSTTQEQTSDQISLAQTDKTILFNLPNSNLQVECRLLPDSLWTITWINAQAGKTKTLDKTFSTSQMLAVTDHLIEASNKHGIYR